MNQRTRRKQQTRTRLLEAAKTLFIETGVEATTTLAIAQACGVAHGTVFAHFKTKDELISQVFVEELRNSILEIEGSTPPDAGFEDMIGAFFTHIRANEEIFSIYFRELPGFPEPLKRALLSFEVALRHRFYDGLKREGAEDDAVATILNLLFSQLMYYYSFKEILCRDRSVINTFGPKIQDTIRTMLR